MIIIDPDKATVRRVKYSGHIDQIYHELGGCEAFDVVQVDDGIDLFVDDEGLYNPANVNHDGSLKVNLMATYLRLRKWLSNPQDYDWNLAQRMYHIVGKVVVLAHDDNGDTLDLDEAQNGEVLELLGQDQTMENEPGEWDDDTKEYAND